MDEKEHAFHHWLLARILRETSEGCFFTTIQNMMAVARDKAYLGYCQDSVSRLLQVGIGRSVYPGVSLPGYNVLSMIVAKIHLGRSSNRYAFCLSIIRLDEVRPHRLLDPYGL